MQIFAKVEHLSAFEEDLKSHKNSEYFMRIWNSEKDLKRQTRVWKLFEEDLKMNWSGSEYIWSGFEEDFEDDCKKIVIGL